MSLSKRLDKVEDRIGGGACPACGNGSEGPVTFRMLEEGDPEPEPCQTCGAQPYRFTLRLDDPNNASGSEATGDGAGDRAGAGPRDARHSPAEGG